MGYKYACFISYERPPKWLDPAPSSAPETLNSPEKVEDIVDLSMDPPKHATIATIDEKSQIQAPNRACR